MKFAAILIAIGAQAIKLREHEGEGEDLGSWETRAENMHSVIDWNGDGLVSGDELSNLIFVAEHYDYITEQEAADLTDFAYEVEDHFGGPFSYDQLEEEVNWIIDEGDEDD